MSCLTAVLLIGGSLYIPQAPKAEVHPAVAPLLDQHQEIPVWIFFVDKGLTLEQQRAALEQVRRALDPRTRARRLLRRVHPGLVDQHDLPLCRAYVDEVKAICGKLRVQSRWLNAVSATVNASQIRALCNLDFVRELEPVRRGRAQAVVPVEGIRPATLPERRALGDFYGLSEQQLQQIGVTDMHDAGYTGEGMVIGVLDTGFSLTHEVYNEPDHEIDVLAQWDFINDDPNAGIDVGDPPSQHNHGTLVLATIAAYKPGALVGGAYDASFVLAKTEDTTDEYEMEEDFYAAGLEFIESNGADVATSSLGYIQWYDWFDLDGLTAVTSIAVNLATSNGLACCTAVGNGGWDQDLPSLIAPSDAFDVLSCGAVNAAGLIADFSSNGPTVDGRVKPEVLAQGADTNTIDPSEDQEYITANGTSLSTPLVASAVSLLIEAHPDWTIDQIRTALFQTADYFEANGMPDPENRRGYGVIDVFAASQVSFCTGDLDGDQNVGVTDLLALLAAWGPCLECPADLDADGSVATPDLLELLALWGPCV